MRLRMPAVMAAVLALLPATASGSDEARSPRVAPKVTVAAGVDALVQLHAGDRLRAKSIAARYETAAEDIAAMRARGYSWSETVEAASLCQAWGLELSRATAARDRGHGLGELGQAVEVAARWESSFEAVLALRESGLGWGRVSAVLEARRDAFRDAPREERPAPAAPPGQPQESRQPRANAGVKAPAGVGLGGRR